MNYILFNAVPIGLATLASLLFGFLWIAAAGGSSRLGEGPPRTVGFALAAVIAELWLCSILAGALILAPPQAGRWVLAIGSAVVLWIGFVLPAVAVTLGYRRQGIKAATLDSVHWLGAMVVQAAVLQAVGVSAPPPA